MIKISCDESKAFEDVAAKVMQNISFEVMSRASRVSNELTNATAFVLRGSRSGRRYLIPGTRRHYTASAPGEPPAVRTGEYRASFKPKEEFEAHGGNDFTAHSRTESDLMVGKGGKYNLGRILEEGAPRANIAPRPHAQKIVERAMPNVLRIYKKPYNAG